MNIKIRGIIRLTRWREFVPFVIPLTVLGALMAIQQSNGQATFDGRLLLVLLANALVVSYGFMINDIEDAPDDAREADRAARNPVACGELTPLQGWVASGGTALISLVLYALAGVWPFVIGLLTLALCHFYSWRPVRLKAWPITDIVSHSLMLSGLLFLSGYFAYGTTPGLIWVVALAATLLSVYGQLYNQLRDFDMDKAANLHNTAIMVGKRNAQWLMYSVIVMAFLLLVYSLVMRIIPLWLAIVPLLSIPALRLVQGPATDMRGTKQVDASGSAQIQFVLVANLTIAVWLVVSMLHG
jgi:4-hydroxybenzoate polyprenyltransferase